MPKQIKVLRGDEVLTKCYALGARRVDIVLFAEDEEDTSTLQNAMGFVEVISGRIFLPTTGNLSSSARQAIADIIRACQTIQEFATSKTVPTNDDDVLLLSVTNGREILLGVARWPRKDDKGCSGKVGNLQLFWWAGMELKKGDKDSKVPPRWFSALCRMGNRLRNQLRRKEKMKTKGEAEPKNTEHREDFDGSLVPLRTLHQSSNSEVFSVATCPASRVFVMKRAQNNDTSEAMVENERRVLEILSDVPCIPKAVQCKDKNVQGKPFLLLDIPIGVSVRKFAIHEPLPVDYVCKLGKQIAKSLHLIHKKGVLYRDICPHNIILDAKGNSYLIDFGLAELVDGDFCDDLVGRSAFHSSFVKKHYCQDFASDWEALIFSLVFALCGRW
eukprot:CAMPEP_0174269922 /NCGR_PEP_ID=MMETSP0439-20130205/42719_1 /TAXON_ID=0 /ORGANISM="Stereomyxa ramosa, Strain Chinc5" /LENGTH=386 /DNA_ID=CAMNT_0015358945 /DNA_START=756 /DNA_END=1913 /DNA_ORIENTATION=-